jgi:hypothetical protein
MQSPIPVSPVIDPASARLQKLAGGDHRGMANDGNETALAPGFNAEQCARRSRSWRLAVSSRCEAARRMIPHGRGAILLTGASASAT